jgi:hypothetical protein
LYSGLNLEKNYMEPLSAGLMAGGSLLTGLLGGIGSGLSAGKELEYRKALEDRRKYEADREYFRQNKLDQSQLGFRGLETLLGMQQSALASTRGKQLRNMILQG